MDSSEEEETITNITDLQLIGMFIGENITDIVKKKVNVGAFLCPILYLFYRKRVIWGVSIFILQILSVSITKSITNSIYFTIIPSIIINLLCGILFNTFYIKNVEKKINEIKNNNPGVSNYELIPLCDEAGGGSFKLVFIGFFICFSIILFINYLYYTLDPFAAALSGVKFNGSIKDISLYILELLLTTIWHLGYSIYYLCAILQNK